ncbi:class I SAM-dependent methyltransferase [Ensifer aridi]|uniref:class I SAM-dependent methyltransferase n=1 Tax=Ensifer aridi TaxID=1708715 RepID=UPI000A117EE4|nr:class I SAM-dependent methyltransferase [Ensifer aridi]
MPSEIRLAGVTATPLITLLAKAEESAMPDSLLRDRFAAAAIARVAEDLTHLKVGHDMTVAIAMRALLLDRWTTAFLDRHSDATVLHLGCGLDARVFRVDPPPSVHWFDVDFPEVIALRQRLYPCRRNYTAIAASITETTWLSQLPTGRPATIIAEGVLPYLGEDEVPQLLSRLVDRFPSGEIVFDAYSRLMIWMLHFNPAIRSTGASLRWALDEPAELERQVPGLKLVEDRSHWSASEAARMSPPARIALQILAATPMLQPMGRLVRYRF